MLIPFLMPWRQQAKEITDVILTRQTGLDTVVTRMDIKYLPCRIALGFIRLANPGVSWSDLNISARTSSGLVLQRPRKQIRRIRKHKDDTLRILEVTKDQKFKSDMIMIVNTRS